jgi:integrase
MTATTRKVTLTVRALDALKPAPAGKRYFIWDAQQPHLGVRVTDRADEEGKAAVRTFVVVKRRPGDRNPVTHVIGSYPAVKLAEARDRVPAILSALANGKLPSEIEAERLREEGRRRRETFGAAVKEFFADELAGLRSGRETEATLRREFLGQTAKRTRVTDERGTRWATEWLDGPEPVWRDRPIADIARRDVIERLDAIKRRGGKHAARHALGAVRKYFNWCAEGERFGVEVSPCASLRDKTIGVSGKDLRRKRVLTDAELRDVWAAAEKLPPAGAVVPGYPFGPLLRLLMLTGQRLNDIAAARWSEVDLDGGTLTVPPERYKTGTAHEVALAPRAVEILRALPRFKRGHVFTTTAGARPVSGFSKMKARLDAAVSEERKKDGREPMSAWVLHDLRRTVRTRLVSDCGVDAFIAERVIGHALPGLHGVYDQGTHRPQKRAAAEAWAARLLAIVEPPKEPAPNVVAPEEVSGGANEGGRKPFPATGSGPGMGIH